MPGPRISAEHTVAPAGEVRTSAAAPATAEQRAGEAEARAAAAKHAARKAERRATEAKAAAKKAAENAAKKGTRAAQKKAVAAKIAANTAARKAHVARRAARAAERRAETARAAVRRASMAQGAVAAEPTPSGDPVLDHNRSLVLDLVNQARAKAGCTGLKYSSMLQRSAQAHADEMSEYDYMSHTSRSGQNSDERIRAAGFQGRRTGENLGQGFSAAESVVDAWLGSPGHRANILECEYTVLGVGFAPVGGYWVQHFGG